MNQNNFINFYELSILYIIIVYRQTPNIVSTSTVATHNAFKIIEYIIEINSMTRKKFSNNKKDK